MKATLIHGPAKCGKTAFAVKKFIEEYNKNPVIITTSSESVYHVKRKILAGIPGFFGRRVITFDHLVNMLTEDKMELTRINKLFFIRDIVKRLELKYFLPVKNYRGFYEILSRFVSELKAGEITPEVFHRGISRKGPTDKDNEIYAIYSTYQDELHRLNIYDHEGKFWHAQQLIEKGTLPFPSCGLLIVDGFHNFSPAELKIIQSLGKYIDEIIITQDRDQDLPGIQDKVQMPAGDRAPEKIKIISCPGQVREVEEIAREIKRLVIYSGRALNDIAVLFRDLSEYKELVAEIFTRYGIPFYLSSGIPLIKDPAVRATLRSLGKMPKEADFHEFTRLLEGLVPADYLEILNNLILLDKKIDSETFYDMLVTVAESAESRIETYGGNTVQVMDAHKARGLSFPVAFVGGLIEKGFPKQISEEPLYGDAERARLRRFGVDVEESKEKQKEEMLLFQSAVNTARECLYLTYPATDNEGKEELTSYYVDEIKKAFPGKIETRKVHLSGVIPKLEDVFTYEELLTRVMYDKIDTGLVDSSHLKRLASINNNGIITDKDILARLNVDFGPAYKFSVSQFNEYGICPFNYFCKRALGLEPIEELEEEIAANEEGNLYHAILREYYAEGGNIETICDKHFKTAEKKGLIKNQALWKLKKEEILSNTIKVIQHENNAPPPLGIKRRPAYFEIPFGMGENPEPLKIGDVLIQGKIDRIDLMESDFFVVVDYKSGGFIRGFNLQLPIYVMAAKDVLQAGIDCLEAYFLYVKRMKHYHANPLSHYRRSKNGLALIPEWDECMEKTKEYVASCAEGIRSGKFPPSPKNECPPYCDYKDICRR